MPARSRLTYRSTRTRVFPVPADASRTMFCAGSIAAMRADASGRSASSASNGSIGSDVTDIVPPAHAGKAARLTAVHIVRRRWKFAARNRVEGRRQPLLRLGEHLVAVRRREERDDAARSLEGEVGR